MSTDSLKLSSASLGQSRLLPMADRLNRLPWWFLAILLLGVLITWSISVDNNYQRVIGPISEGISITVVVTAVAYTLSIVLGLLISLARISSNVVARNVSTFFVEIMRGVPVLVIIFYVAIVMVPGAVSLIKSLGTTMSEAGILPDLARNLAGIQQSGVDNTFRVVIALTLAYAAFISEIFRAGIESIDRGQMEAARALGMTYRQAMIHIILRQAIRQVLPPLGNDLIAMLKDSSLVSVLGVRDITYQGRVYGASTFMFVETYNVLAYLYLTMTLMLSFLVKWLERRVARERKNG
jgi:polar amino acid transport system permease protein